METASTVIRCPMGSVRYVWRKGDTLRSVATAFGTTVGAMIEVNPDIDFMSIRENTQICIPTRALTCPDADLYRIQKGDTLWDLARSYGIPVGELIDMNPYVEPTKLMIGQYICVPKKNNVPETPETPSPGEPGCVIGSDVPDCTSLRAAEKACTGTDTVKCGQSLYDILAKYGISYAEFADLNPRLVLNALLPGQTYVYPLKQCNCSESGRYTLVPGDTVSGVAASFGLTPSELMRRNPSLRASDFTVGREICVSYPFA